MSQSRRDGKRKRSKSPSVHETVINPRSHPPHVLKQFVVAGLSPEEPLPSTITADFPHRRQVDADTEHDATTTDDDDEDDGEDEAAVAAARSRRLAAAADRAHERAVGALVAMARQQLAVGDLGRARRAFALLVRSRVAHGRRVDLRRDGYWALGLEILRAEGRRGLDADADADAGQEKETDEQELPRRRRRGHFMRAAPPTNLDQVLAYLGTLARQFPPAKSSPGAVGAVDFYPALFGYEVMSIYGVHDAGLARAEAAAASWDEDVAMADAQLETEPPSVDVDDEDDVRPDMDARQETLRSETDRLRLVVLERLRDVEGRMDELMQGQPYSRDHEMLRLRAMVALYTGDVLLPPAPRTPREHREGTLARDAKRQQARELFLKMDGSGGDLAESWIEDLVKDEEDSDEEDRGPVMFSSLPIR